MKRFTFSLIVGAMSFDLITVAADHNQAARNIDQMLNIGCYGVVSVKEEKIGFQQF